MSTYRMHMMPIMTGSVDAAVRTAGEWPMLIRDCAGGVVFHIDRVLLLRNERGEWVLPKGVVPQGALSQVSALDHVFNETGVSARVIGVAGETSYEFYSTSRKTPVNNRILWYIMAADTDSLHPSLDLGFTDGGYFEQTEAMELITYSQDKGLLMRAFERLRQIRDAN